MNLHPIIQAQLLKEVMDVQLPNRDFLPRKAELCRPIAGEPVKTPESVQISTLQELEAARGEQAFRRAEELEGFHSYRV